MIHVNTVTVIGVTGTMGANIEGIFASFGDARNGMMLNIGGSATTNYVFIIGKEDE